MSRRTPPRAGMALHPASTPRFTDDVRRGTVLRAIVDRQSRTEGPSSAAFLDRSFRIVRGSTASANRKQLGSPRSCGNHPSIWASSGHRFVRYFGGAWPIRRDSTTGWDQEEHGCSPPTFSRLGPSRGSSERSVQSVSVPVRRSLLAASLEASPVGTPFRPSTSAGRPRRSAGPG
jgi:hypothetical protein